MITESAISAYNASVRQIVATGETGTIREFESRAVFNEHRPDDRLHRLGTSS